MTSERLGPIQQFYTPKKLLYPKNKFLATPLVNTLGSLTRKGKVQRSLGLSASIFEQFQYNNC